MKKIYSLTILFIATAVFGCSSFFLYITSNLPPVEELMQRKIIESTKIYDKTSSVLLYEISGDERRTVVDLQDIPSHVKNATIAIEDEDFYKHSAFDLKALARAFFVNLTKLKIVQGGSTITQQLVKNTFLYPKKSLKRKIQELILAIKIEKKYTKDKILGLYLNQIPYGLNAYGVETASQIYFNKSVKDVNLAEAALLAALPKAPTYYSPYGSHKNELLERKDFVLEKMHKLGMITDKEKETAQKYKLNFSKQISAIKAPHFVMAIKDYLANKYGEDFVRTSGLRVITTLDWELQQIAETVVYDGAKKNEELYKGENAALVAQDATNGQILALVGSRDFFDKEIDGNFNVAIQGLRQPGSALKPFAYLELFKKGFSPDSVIFDVRTEFDTTEKPENSYAPNNFDERYRGPVNLRNALAQSINVPAVKVLYLVGLDNFLKTIKDFGINTLTERSRYGMSLILGGGEVRLSELVNAYSTMAQEGINHKQAMILEIKDKDGRIIESYKDETNNIIDAQYPSLINDILSDIEARSPLYQNSLSLTIFPEHDVALKTGTSNDYRDAWTIGYTPSLVVGVWAGNNDNTPMQKKGSSILATVPIWSAFMQKALGIWPHTEIFNKPDEIIAQKPMLNGEYIINFKDSDNNEYPQIHNILFYIDKDDPLGTAPKNPYADSQFENWEKGVINWATSTIQNFESIFNKPIPSNYITETPNPLSFIKININSPNNGDFVKNQFALSFNVDSSQQLKSIEIYLNDKKIDYTDILDKNIKSYNYIKTIQLELEIQNLLKIVISDKNNNQTSKALIVYKEEQ